MPVTTRSSNTIGFVLIGGEHQLLHIVPVAAALARSGVQVKLFASTEKVRAAAAQLMQRLGGKDFSIETLGLPSLLEHLAGRNTLGSSLKLPRLLWHAAKLRGCRALVTAERTSAILKLLPGRCPPMLHIPHGAGDRAVGFERRIALFDAVIVAGEKDRQRMLAARLLPPERCHVSGYVKLSTVRQLRGSGPRLFDNDQPVVLYNPHFDPRLSSWSRTGAGIIDRIRASGQFNLIVAPHVRLFATARRSRRLEWERMAVPGRVLVDLGSSRSVDMTYTLAADIYLGDVSSQVYEFAAEPRPCVFIDSHAAAWRGNPDYRMWEMGEVVDRLEEVVPALQRARQLHAGYLHTQRRLVAEAVGDVDARCAERAAELVLRFAG